MTRWIISLTIFVSLCCGLAFFSYQHWIGQLSQREHQQPPQLLTAHQPKPLPAVPQTKPSGDVVAISYNEPIANEATDAGLPDLPPLPPVNGASEVAFAAGSPAAAPAPSLAPSPAPKPADELAQAVDEGAKAARPAAPIFPELATEKPELESTTSADNTPSDAVPSLTDSSPVQPELESSPQSLASGNRALELLSESSEPTSKVPADEKAKPLSSRDAFAAIEPAPAPLAAELTAEASKANINHVSPQVAHAPRQVSTNTDGSAQSLSIDWIVPQNVNLGQEADCQLVIRNTGKTPAFRAILHVNLPANSELTYAQPQAHQAGNILSWNLNSIPAGKSHSLRIGLRPTSSGSITPVAALTLTRANSTEIEILEPKLDLEIKSPTEVIAGQPAVLEFVVTNPGSGTVADVIVTATLDSHLHHPRGNALRFRLGTLGSNESRRVRIPITGLEPGKFLVSGTAAAGDLTVGAKADLEIRRPTLDVKLVGPKRRFVNRRAKYVVSVNNPGGAAANNVQVVAKVPEGFSFVGASNGGGYDAEVRQVSWFVGRMESNESATLSVELSPNQLGEYDVSAEVTADSGVRSESETLTQVEGDAAVSLKIVDSEDPVEVNAETQYLVHVTNQGSIDAHDVQVAVILAEETKPLGTDGPTKGVTTGQRVVFEEIDALAPGETKTYKIRVRCVAPGRALLRAFFRSAENETPVQIEEATRIYAE